MTRLALVILAAGLAMHAEEASKKTEAPAKASPSAGRSDNADIIPANAKQVDAHTWMAEDKNGKKWFYRQTPFGVVKTDQDPDAPAPVAKRTPFDGPKAPAKPGASQPVVKVTEVGDTYVFERHTPFGPSRWTRKKSDLTDAEKALVADSKPATPAAK